MCPHGVYPCRPPADRAESWVAIAVADDAQWRRLAEIIGADAAMTFGQRRASRAEIDVAMSGWTSGLSVSEVEETLQGVGVSAHCLATTEDAAHDPQLAHRDHFRRLPHTLHGETVVEGAALHPFGDGGAACASCASVRGAQPDHPLGAARPERLGDRRAGRERGAQLGPARIASPFPLLSFGPAVDCESINFGGAAFLGRKLAGMGAILRVFAGNLGVWCSDLSRFVQICLDWSRFCDCFAAEQSGLIQMSPGLRFGGCGGHGGHSDSLGCR